MISSRSLLAALLLLLAPNLPGAAPKNSANWLTFSMLREGPPAQRYTIRLNQATGRGFFHSDEPAPGQPPAAAAPVADSPIAVSEPMLHQLFAVVPTVRSQRCESRMRGIAQTGQKTLRFESDGGVSQCTFNYSGDDRLNTATTDFEALAETMQYGDRLRAKLRFDRLGLDAEMESLQKSLDVGTALEVRNIAPVLAAIQGDDRVMERVRRKAAHLLQSAGLPVAQPAGELKGDKDASER